MNIRDSDLLKLRKDIERVRKHEESRRLREQDEPSSADEPATPDNDPDRLRSVPISERFRQIFAALLELPDPSAESLHAIPDHVVTLLQAIRGQPEFTKWLLAIEALSPALRNDQLTRMAFAFRVEDAKSTIAAAFDCLQKPILFEAFCHALRDETEAAA